MTSRPVMKEEMGKKWFPRRETQCRDVQYYKEPIRESGSPHTLTLLYRVLSIAHQPYCFIRWFRPCVKAAEVAKVSLLHERYHLNCYTVQF